MPGRASATRAIQLGQRAKSPFGVSPFLYTFVFSAVTPVAIAAWLAALEGRASGIVCAVSVLKPL